MIEVLAWVLVMIVLGSAAGYLVERGAEWLDLALARRAKRAERSEA